MKRARWTRFHSRFEEVKALAGHNPVRAQAAETATVPGWVIRAADLDGMGARSPRSVKLLKRLQSSREALQEKRAGSRFTEYGRWGLGKTAEKFRNAPQFPFSRLFPQILQDVVSVEPLGLGLEIVRDILLEIFQRHDYAADPA